MNMTTSGIHGVVNLTIGEVQQAEDVRWQIIIATQADGSMHQTTYYLKPGCEGLPPTKYASSIGGQKLPEDIGGYR